MSIEFRCTNCQKLLATPPGTHGARAKCPQCGTLLVVPEPGSAFDETTSALETPPPRNPDFAAAGESRAGELGGAARFEQAELNPGSPAGPAFEPMRIDFGEVLRVTWRLYTNNFGGLVLGGLLYYVCRNAAAGATLAIGAALVDDAPELAPLVGIAALIALVFCWAFFLVGLMKFMLAVARDGRVEYGELFSAGPLTMPAAGVLALLLLGTGAGLIFLLIPGVLFLLVFSQSPFLLVDQRTGIRDSLRYSAFATRGNLWTLLLLGVTVSLATLMIVVFTCGIGGIFTVPYVGLLLAVVYLGVTGQHTALDGASRVQVERPFDSSGMQPT